MLGENVALVSFINKPLAKDGAIVSVRAGTYSLRRTDDGWRSRSSAPIRPPISSSSTERLSDACGLEFSHIAGARDLHSKAHPVLPAGVGGEVAPACFVQP